MRAVQILAIGVVASGVTLGVRAQEYGRLSPAQEQVAVRAAVARAAQAGGGALPLVGRWTWKRYAEYRNPLLIQVIDRALVENRPELVEMALLDGRADPNIYGALREVETGEIRKFPALSYAIYRCGDGDGDGGGGGGDGEGTGTLEGFAYAGCPRLIESILKHPRTHLHLTSQKLSYPSFERVPSFVNLRWEVENDTALDLAFSRAPALLAPDSPALPLLLQACAAPGSTTVRGGASASASASASALENALSCGPKLLTVAQELVDGGADVNVKDAQGKPLLHRLYSECNEEAVEFLLKNGADPAPHLLPRVEMLKSRVVIDASKSPEEIEAETKRAQGRCERTSKMFKQAVEKHRQQQRQKTPRKAPQRAPQNGPKTSANGGVWK